MLTDLTILVATIGATTHERLNTSAIATLLILASAIMLSCAQLDRRRAVLANDLAMVAGVMREIARSVDVSAMRSASSPVLRSAAWWSPTGTGASSSPRPTASTTRSSACSSWTDAAREAPR